MESRSFRAEQARTEGTREKTAHARVWQPPGKLEAPEPRPGYRQKWVRTAAAGVAEPHHYASRLREGWEPRKAETAPDFPQSKDGLIEMNGLVLCEMPEHMVEQRNAYYQGRTVNQDQAVEHDLLKDEKPGAPIHQDRKSTVTKGGVPKVKDDD